MDLSFLVNTCFAGCRCIHRVDAQPMFEKGEDILIYEIPNVIGKYGAVYPDGASCIWPAAWLTGRSKSKVKGPPRKKLKIMRRELKFKNIRKVLK